MNPAVSWVYDWVLDPKKIGATQGEVTALLVHEQGHFDLSALAMREFLNEAQGLTNDQADALWKSFQTRLDDLNKLYDSSTQHSQNQANQDLWVQEIKNLKSSQNGTFTALYQWAQNL